MEALDLTIERGEIYGFLGRNGAGKTTTIRMMLGMVRPSAGSVCVLGERVAHGRGPWRRVGHMVETPSAYPELTVRQNLEVARRLSGEADATATIRGLERFELGEWADRRARELSTGNLQRLGLARALLHEPELVVLDEPANGLDPAGVVAVRDLLRELSRERGLTVFMSSHVLGEVDRLATRIGIIHHGRLIEELSVAELERRRGRWLSIEVRDRDAARAALAQAGHAVDAEEGRGRLRLRGEAAVEAPDEVARLLVAAGTPPLRLLVEHEDLEAHFLALTGET